MSEKRKELLLVGVGGQGVVSAARILGDAVHSAGLQVVVGQLHGMSRRGGSVACSVLIGPGRSSYVSRPDLVVGFEPLEVVRIQHRMGPGTKVLVNPGKITPLLLTRAGQPYPSLEHAFAEMRACVEELVWVDGSEAVKQINGARVLNVFMLGALQGLGWLPVDEATLWEAVAHRCGTRYLAANEMAFSLGRSSVVGGATPGMDASVTCGGSP
jgi:indolepyruvate ferredoxin oxidoreductase beta subunit